MADFLSVLFNPNRPFVPTRVSGGTTNGRIISQPPKDPDEHLDNSEKLMYEEDVDLMKRDLKNKFTKLDIQNIDEPASERPTDEVYKKYSFGHRTQAATQLPVHAFKSEILSAIANCPAVVIEGSTGCGKTTQVQSVFIRYFPFFVLFELEIKSIRFSFFRIK